MKRKLFKGRFTTTLDYDINDVFFDINNSLMKVFNYNKKGQNISYITDANNRFLLVMINDVDAAISCKMVKCEMVLREPLTDKLNIMVNYDINEEEWDNVMASYPNLNSKEPIKSVFEYDMLLVGPEGYSEYLEAATELLKELC